MMSLLHDAFKQSGVAVEMLTLELCNHPIVQGSVAHHNQPDCKYRLAYHLVLDGQPLGFRSFQGINAQMEVIPSIALCEELAQCRMRQDHPQVPTWHLASRMEQGPFYLLPGYIAVIQAALDPMLAQFRAEQISEATTATASPRTRSRL